MKTLYIDTSSNYLYTAIVEDNKIKAEIKKEFNHDLSEKALPEIVSMFEKTKINANEINKIMVVNGPGSFTGIRIGITIAKVYAWSLNIPIVTLNSLEAMAVSSKYDGIKIPMIDARRKYVYGAIYDENNLCQYKPRHVLLEELKKEIKQDKYRIISNDNIENIDSSMVEKYNPDIIKIVNFYSDREALNPHSVNPEYLKLTEAEEANLNDNRIK